MIVMRSILWLVRSLKVLVLGLFTCVVCVPKRFVMAAWCVLRMGVLGISFGVYQAVFGLCWGMYKILREIMRAGRYVLRLPYRVCLGLFSFVKYSAFSFGRFLNAFRRKTVQRVARLFGMVYRGLALCFSGLWRWSLMVARTPYYGALAFFSMMQCTYVLSLAGLNKVIDSIGVATYGLARMVKVGLSRIVCGVAAFNVFNVVKTRYMRTGFAAVLIAVCAGLYAYLLLQTGGYDFKTMKETSLQGVKAASAMPFSTLELSDVSALNNITPAAGASTAHNHESGRSELYKSAAFEGDDEDGKTFQLETILLPQRNTVISSSRDGKIVKVKVHNGDVFKKGDLLIEYDCRALEAELSALRSKKSVNREKAVRAAKLFNLEIISDIENLTLNSDLVKSQAELLAMEKRLESCEIRADYNGRVTNRIANPGEYTRTDRVLMEVSSLDTLQAEFLMPSIWLRWVNVGAPVQVSIHETGETYEATIIRFHGEVDPASQSIQATAALKPYQTPLLPGMSGSVFIDKTVVEAEGIQGFLKSKRAL